MTKPFQHVPKPDAKPVRTDGKKAEAPKTSLAYTIRETVESIVIAFVLAFLFRTFEAEAFVIPTGSMAPTLQGRHKDVVCPQCQYPYRASASSEVDDDGRPVGRGEVVESTCPMCRHAKQINPDDDPSYNGDRILVGKFPYDFAEPKRWDVIVFKFPGDSKMNYIKRLVGLPNERLEIYQGDLFRISEVDDSVEILRKPPDKVRAMAQIVYDNDFVVDEMTSKGWPLRWRPWTNVGSEKETWTTNDGGRSYSIHATGQPQWIRYQHFPPSQSDWAMLEQGKVSPKVLPQLITDFYAYNTNLDDSGKGSDRANLAGLNWVGDLMLQCQVDVEGDTGLVSLDLVRGGVHFLCTIDVATGEAKLTIPGYSETENSGKSPVGSSKLKGPGKYEIVYANFDHQLTLWVGGKLVEFDEPTTYNIDASIPRSSPADAGDLAPAGISADGVQMHVSNIKLWRDIYYIATNNPHFPMADWTDRHVTREEQKRLLADPSQWTVFAPDNMRRIPIDLIADQFYVLGDNSPFSKDSRLWDPDQPYVKRELLIGKALYIYWPHSFDQLPGTKIPFPFFPNFGSMGFVR